MGKRGFISANNALFVSVDLIGEKNQIILELSFIMDFSSEFQYFLRKAPSAIQTSEFRLQSSDFRLQCSDFRLQISDLST